MTIQVSWFAPLSCGRGAQLCWAKLNEVQPTSPNRPNQVGLKLSYAQPLDRRGTAQTCIVTIMFGISGLILLEDYISQEHHDWLIERIDAEVWDTSLKRRVQHYGYRYDYKARRVDPNQFLGPLPSWLERIANQIYKDGLVSVIPDQVIVNEYEPGQGIAKHIDCEPCFGDKIFSLSLGSHATFEMTHDSNEKVSLLLEPRSLLMMYGESRYEWKHGIPARKKDGNRLRERRISLTFRKTII